MVQQNWPGLVHIEPTIEIFLSHHEQDEPLLRELETHLGALQRSHSFEIWHQGKILPGTVVKQSHHEHLNKAQIILLLISPYFMNSDDCYLHQMQPAIERHERGEARVIPILLCPVDWQSAPFGKLKTLPSNGKPITLWRNRNAAFADIVQGVRATIQEIQNGLVNMPSSSPFQAAQSSAKSGEVLLSRFRALLSYGKFRGKGIHLSNVTLFGSRIDIDT